MLNIFNKLLAKNYCNCKVIKITQKYATINQIANNCKYSNKFNKKNYSTLTNYNNNNDNNNNNNFFFGIISFIFFGKIFIMVNS